MDLSSMLASFASAFTQQGRVLAVHFGRDGPMAGSLLPHRLTGSQGLSVPYRYVLQCLSCDAAVELKSLLGRAVVVEIRAEDEPRQVITGVISSVAAAGSDGGFARYDLTIEPPLALLTLRTTSRVFQDQSVPDIVQTLVGEHIRDNALFGAHFALRFDLAKNCSSRSYTVQYRESDLDFIQRILAEEGIAYRFEFEAGDIPLTTLVPFDDPYQLDQSALGRVRFHRADGTEAEDALTQWSAQRRVISSSVSLASFDYKAAGNTTALDDSAVNQGDAGQLLQKTLTCYDVPGAYYARDGDEQERYASLRQQAVDIGAKQFSGEGTLRGLEVGQWFLLEDHPAHESDMPEDRQFTVTHTALTVRSNLPGKDLEASEAPFHIAFLAQRRGLPLLPDFAGSPLGKPTAPGAQTAVVVGPAGEEIHTDDQGRIKVRFHWQRREEHPQTGANNDDNSSCWVRMAMPSAGDGWGYQHIPRVGQEVVVIFLEGDIDRPLVVGVVYNGAHRTPAFSGTGSLPANKILSGFRSCEYKGRQYNELLFDDSTGEVRIRLSSEHGKTQLNLGYLVHPRDGSKAQQRGDGFELRTDRHGAFRAGRGIFISADAARNAVGKQLDRDPALNGLTNASALKTSLGEAAAHQLVGKPRPEEPLQDAIQDWETGKESAVLLFSAPDGIASTTPKSQIIAAGTDLDITAQRDTQQTTGRRWLHNVGQSISLFVVGVADTIALKLISAKGRVQIQAQSDSVEISAAKNIIQSAQGVISANAGEEILLSAGGAYIRIGNGNIQIHAPGKVDAKGTTHGIEGPTSQRWPQPDFPEVAMDKSSQSLLVRDGRSGQPHEAKFKLLGEASEIEKRPGQVSGLTQRNIEDEPRYRRALLGMAKKWNMDYIVPPAPGPVYRKDEE